MGVIVMGPVVIGHFVMSLLVMGPDVGVPSIKRERYKTGAHCP